VNSSPNCVVKAFVKSLLALAKSPPRTNSSPLSASLFFFLSSFLSANGVRVAELGLLLLTFPALAESAPFKKT